MAPLSGRSARMNKYQLRTGLAMGHDAVACALAWLAAFALRFNFDMPGFYVHVALTSLPWALLVYLVLFRVLGLYRGIWRYASLPDLKRILMAVLIGAAAVPTLMLMLRLPIPRSVLVMHPILLGVLMCGSRLAYRAWKERRLQSLIPGEREPVLVLVATEAAVSLIKDLVRSHEWRVVGVLDDDASKRGRHLVGVPVLGRMDELAERGAELGIEHAIIAMPDAAHETRRRAVELCRAAQVKALTVPSFDDLVSGRVTISQIRRVELDDLLGRDPVVLDTAGLRNWLADRVVMVTGAGGSIGSELCRQIARYAPRRLVLYELNEYALYTIEQEMRERLPGLAIVYAIGDVRDRARVTQILAAHRPSVVFHAAAYKHVPLMEADNAWQAVQNNVAGTRVIAEASIAHAVEKFVLVSTDKAVNPTNVMGATKRLAEMVCQALQRTAATRFVMVRFGNVLGSTGSVIPKFREQIARGGPVTVTHPEVTRYFMSIPEAVQLVLQAGLMGNGGEIYVLDMGKPVRIADLARDMIRLSGFSERDIVIVYTGLRPGAKLYEELLASDENTLPTPHAKLRIVRARPEDLSWLARLAAWLDRPDHPDGDTVKRELGEWVAEYRAPLAAEPVSAVS
jgi:FlaA1/EpsC-like NDP-sugar epimerase